MASYQSWRTGGLLPGDTQVTLTCLLFSSRQRILHQSPNISRNSSCRCSSGEVNSLLPEVSQRPIFLSAGFTLVQWEQREARACRVDRKCVFLSCPSTLWLAHSTPVSPSPHGSSQTPGLSQTQGLFTCSLWRNHSFLRCPHDTPSPHSGLLKYHLRELLPANCSPGLPRNPTPLSSFISLCYAYHCLTHYHFTHTCFLPPFPLRNISSVRTVLVSAVASVPRTVPGNKGCLNVL